MNPGSQATSGGADPEGSGAEAYFLSVIRGRPGILPGLLRLGLAALAPIYSGGLKLFLLPYRLGIRRQVRLPCPVIVVGNLTTGGTGKTPLTQTLCRMLQACGLRVAVLNRGYGGKHEYGCAMVSDAAEVYLEAFEAGDEAVLLAKTLPGVPVMVGKDRRRTGRSAWERFHPDVLVLDDGLQYWQLHRDLNIVLLNAREPFDNGWTFPRGLLREPPSHLKRAGMVVLTNAEHVEATQLRGLKEQVERLAPGRPLFTAAMAPTGLRHLGGGEPASLEWLNGKPVTSLCALGHPESFERTLSALGADLVERIRFRDHQGISEAALERVLDRSRKAGAAAVIVTEKDAVKLTIGQTMPPVFSLQARMRVDRDAEFLEVVRGALASRCTV